MFQCKVPHSSESLTFCIDLSCQGRSGLCARLEVDLVVTLVPAGGGRPRQVISQHGRVLHLEDTGEDIGTQVIGIVRSEIANLNSAMMTVTTRPTAAGSRLVIREAMIKQRSGDKVVSG